MTAICGCGQNLNAAPPPLFATDTNGIIITGTQQNPGTTITAVDATAWRPFTPTTINFTVGNGDVEARQLVNGKNVDLIITIRFAGSSTWAGAQFEIAPPWPIYSPGTIKDNIGQLGRWSIFDASAANWREGFLIQTPGDNIAFRVGDDNSGTNTTMQQGTPITFTTFDELHLQAHYETF